MDYLNEAFGSFVPHLDKDAAVKFVLNVILMDGRFDKLSDLLTEGDDIGAIAGEPAWILERRDPGEAGNMPGYAFAGTKRDFQPLRRRFQPSNVLRGKSS